MIKGLQMQIYKIIMMRSIGKFWDYIFLFIISSFIP